MAELLSVNLAVPRTNPAKNVGVTGIDKRPAAGPVLVRKPAPSASGLAGDQIFDVAHHGGEDQAVYGYAREDLDTWAAELGRPLANGVFGENITTSGLEVTGALIGECWRIGDGVVLQVSVPRIPCRTFAHWMAEHDWIKRFTQRAAPGTYLRVVTPGEIRGGDPVSVVHRPDHDITVGLTFRALTLEPELLARLVDCMDLPAAVRARAARRAA